MSSTYVSLVTNEKQTIASLLDDPEYVLKFEKNYFISAIARDMFETVQELVLHSVDLTDEHLVSEGNKRNNGITKAFLEELRKEKRDVSLFESFYFPRLKKDFAKYTIEQHLLKDALIETSKKGELDVEKIKRLIEGLNEGLELIQGKESILMTPKKMMDVYQTALYGRMKGSHTFGSGDHHLDKLLTVGFAPGQMTTIFGATGVGKSAYVLNLVNRQMNKRIPSLYVSMEMDTVATSDRLVAMKNRIPLSVFYPDENGMIPEFIFEVLEKERALFEANDKFLFVERPDLNLTDIELLIKEAKRRTKSDYLVVTIDLLTMLEEFSGEDAKGYEDAMNQLHRIAKRQRVHIVNVVQANRSTDNVKIYQARDVNRLRPTINTIKNSHAIAERSRIVLSVFRPKYYISRLLPEDPELEVMEDTMEVATLKQSQGQVGNIAHYLFDSETFLCIPIMQSPQEIRMAREQAVASNASQEESNG